MPHYQTTLPLLLLLLPLATPRSQPKAIEDLRSITFQPAGKDYQLSLEIQHHTIKVRPQLESGRSWVKEGSCKVCKDSD